MDLTEFSPEMRETYDEAPLKPERRASNRMAKMALRKKPKKAKGN